MSRSNGLLKLAALSAVLSPACTPSAEAVGRDGQTMRVLACRNEDAVMELYLPLKLAVGGVDILSMPSTFGYYALDLTNAGKGKPLESVLVSISRDRKFVIVNQYDRKLPPTRIPVGGGTLDFDQRFGKQAKCDAFNSRE